MITLKNTKPFWIAIFVLLNSFNIVAQPSDKYKIEAMFLYNFTKYVEWKNQSQWDTFQIGILGNDTSMLNAINWMAETKTAKGKPIVPMLYKNPESIKSPQMLYVDKNSNFEMQEILSAIKGKNIL